MTGGKILLLGAGCGLGAGNMGCGDGPLALQRSQLFQNFLKQYPQFCWDEIILTDHQVPAQERFPRLLAFLEALAARSFKLNQEKQPFIVIGGDHACAIGTWRGYQAAKENKDPIGMLWIDAHMDAHTHETSDTGNVHGMPVAALLNQGSPALTNILCNNTDTAAFSSKHLVLLGIRSFEPKEQDLLKKLKVRHYLMQDIQARGLADVFTEALACVRGAPAGYGLSIDLDALDPSDVPGVGTPVENGIKVKALLRQLYRLGLDKQFLGLEITEFNPHRDKDNKSIHTIIHLIQSIYGLSERGDDEQRNNTTRATVLCE